MIKNIVRVVACLLIVVCAVVGFLTVRFYSAEDSDVGLHLVCLLYEYDSIEEPEQRMSTLKALCTPEVYAQLCTDNIDHYTDAYGRVGSYSTEVKLVFDRPGLIVYALNNAIAYPTDLWVLQYEISDGLVSSVREYKLVGWREDKNGGLF